PNTCSARSGATLPGSHRQATTIAPVEASAIQRPDASVACGAPLTSSLKPANASTARQTSAATAATRWKPNPPQEGRKPVTLPGASSAGRMIHFSTAKETSAGSSQIVTLALTKSGSATSPGARKYHQIDRARLARIPAA